MKNDKKSLVAIVRVKDEEISEALNNLLELLSGIETYVLPFQTVLLKPNWVSGQSYKTGAVTHPALIEGCVKQVLKCGVKQIYIGDSSMVGIKTEEAIENSGISKLESSRVKIINFKKSEYINIGISNALKYRRLEFPKELLESQVIINLPVLKTHDYLPTTLGLKNMKGVLRDIDKRRFHSLGLEEGIIDTNKIALADLTIIDGIVGMEGNGPLHGTPANTKILIGSMDALAAEVVALHVMGMGDLKLRYIDLAYEAGFGEKDLKNIEIVGENIKNVQKKFVKNYDVERTLCDGKIVFSTEKACSTCKFIVDQIIQDSKVKSLKISQKKKLFFGSIGTIDPSEITLAVGNCCAINKEKCNAFIPGCPPKKNDIIKAIKDD